MTPEEYKKAKGMEALGGCCGAAIIFVAIPVVFGLTGSFIGAIVFGAVLFVGLVALLHRKAK
jgi:hypothetical protein